MEDLKRYDTPFSNYLDDDREKFAAVITKCQYAIEIGTYIAHEDMIKDLIQQTRPDIALDFWGNAINASEKYVNSNIVLCGYSGYVLIELPEKEMLSPEQFNMLKEILLAIKEHNFNVKTNYCGASYELVVFGNGVVSIDGANYEDNIDTLIEELAKYVKEPTSIAKERIIGRKFDNVNVDEIQAIPDKPAFDFSSVDWDELLTTCLGNNVTGNDKERKTHISGYASVVILGVVSTIICLGILVLGVYLFHS